MLTAAVALNLRAFGQEKCVWVAAKWAEMTPDDGKTARPKEAEVKKAASALSGTVNLAIMRSGWADRPSIWETWIDSAKSVTGCQLIAGLFSGFPSISILSLGRLPFSAASLELSFVFR